MKKINDWVIKTFGLRGSWSWAKKQMLNGAIIKRKATTGTYKIAIDDDKNRLLVATWDHLDQNPVWERCPHSLLDEDAVDYFVTAHKELSYGGIKIRMKIESMKKITDKDVEALKAGKKVTKGFIHMQLDDKGRLNLWSDINITGNGDYI